jgi:serine/threonine protein kinase
MTTEAGHRDADGSRAPASGLVGPYRLVEQLGEGGMGVVHLALDPHGRAVALKLLRPHVAHDSHARARLRREVDVLGRISTATAPIS